MESLKNKPLIQVMINIGSSVVVVLLAFWLTGWSTTRIAEEERITRLEKEKATYIYVDENCKEMEGKLEKHAQYDKVQDEKIETMRKEWREDQKEILILIRGL